MNDPSEATRRAETGVGRINGHATDNELVYSKHNVGLAEMFQHGTPELADHMKLWPLSAGAQQLGSENGPHSEFMTVFSHELRNSLSAIRSATGILRMETSAGPVTVKACALIERQVGQMARLVEDLLDVSRVRSGHLRLERGIPVRRIEIAKYRGSDFSPGEYPLSFGPRGLEVAAPGTTESRYEVSTERVSSGFKGLDSMLGGGLFRGSSTLITGAPGTSKTTLGGLFAESACRRGERTLFVSFDEGGARIRRNLTSVGIHLERHLQSGLLRMYSGRTDSVNPEEHLISIAALILEHQPRCMVIDPLSAISRTDALSLARAVCNRIIHTVRDNNITAFITSLVEGDDPQAEATELQISTIADTWIHLSYLVRGGERNRALTIIKSRGTQHSNQVRELVLSATGPELMDVYSSGGDVLMGTLRWEKEAEGRARKLQQQAEYGHKRRQLQFAEADIAARITALQLDLERQRAELARCTLDDETRQVSAGEWQNTVRTMRSADTVVTVAPAPGKHRAARISAKSRTNGDQEPENGP